MPFIGPESDRIELDYQAQSVQAVTPQQERVNQYRAQADDLLRGEAVRAGNPEAMQPDGLNPSYLLDPAGSVGGSIAGGRMGRALGPVGMMAGSIAGGIVGGAAGKEARQAVDPSVTDQTFMENIGQSAKEEAIGLGLSVPAGFAVRKGAELLAPAYQQVNRLVSGKPSKSMTEIESQYLTQKDVNPFDASGDTIVDAQKRVFEEERPLTIFEETRGRVGSRQSEELGDKVLRSSQESAMQSTFLQNRKKMNERLRDVLGNKGVEKTEEATGRVLLKNMTDVLGTFNNEYETLTKTMQDLGSTISINPSRTNVVEKLRAAANNAPQELGESQTEKLFTPIYRVIADGQPITATQLRTLEANIKNDLPDFSQAKDVQNKVMGWYSANVKPALDNMLKDEALRNPAAAEFLKAKNKHAEISSIRGDIINSKVGKALGLTDGRQAAKAPKEMRVDSVIYESPETWQQTKNILERTNPELIPVLQDRFRGLILKQSFNPKTKEFSHDGIQKVLNKYGDDGVRSIVGDDYLQALKDSSIISLAMESSSGLANAARGIKMPDDTLTEIGNAIRYPLGRNRAIWQIITGSKSLFGFKNVSDEATFKAFQGENGARLMERALQTRFLASPEAYDVYRQIAREYQKLDQEVQLLSERSFNKRIENINTFLQPLEQINQGEQ